MFIAWDIETCPFDVRSFTPAQQKRYTSLLEKAGTPDATPEDDISVKVRSLNPTLGWICCISVLAADDPEQPRAPKSYLAATPDEEEEMLVNFWTDLARLGNRPIQWITFNGKNFDSEFLLARTLRYGLEPSRKDLLDCYPYSFSPHCDLMKLWPRTPMCLEELCELLEVPSSKDEMNGSKVWTFVQAGDMEKVRQYCEEDVRATLECFSRIPQSIFSKQGNSKS